jgi:hypothetical protein
MSLKKRTEVLSRGWYQWEGERLKVRMNMVEILCIQYRNGTLRLV